MELELATINDVESRLGETIDPGEYDRVEGLLEEASVQVESFLGTVPDPVPRAVRVVVSRMVARVLQAPSGDGVHAESTSFTAGPFAKNITYTSGASGGAPWMTAADKKMLRSLRGQGGIYTISVV